MRSDGSTTTPVKALHGSTRGTLLVTREGTDRVCTRLAARNTRAALPREPGPLPTATRRGARKNPQALNGDRRAALDFRKTWSFSHEARP